MKFCPECGTQYEDHVPTCIADGTELVPQVAPPPHSGTPAPITPAHPTPAVAPSTAPAGATSPSAMGGGASILILALLLFGALAVAGVGVIGIVAWQLQSQPAPKQAPITPLSTRPDPIPTAPDHPPVTVSLDSTPAGAEVFENGQFVCTTPCAIDHPNHAPLPRTFVFKAQGHRDQPFEMTDVTQPILVAMRAVKAAPARPAPATKARPTIGRDR